MRSSSLNLDVTRFLAEHWQRRPCVIRQALSGFDDPLDEHDLAGLAQESSIDSRIVAFNEEQWHVHHGPFEDFDHACQGKWTLLVQGVDKWIEPINTLAHCFSFIPYWRFDDVMVSYAVAGAGVGPHVDQYDVFLLQGKGKRRWQVGNPQTQSSVSPHRDLRQVPPFTPILDVELEAGDILYIPPGWPHCGESIEPSLTYSIGFRAPNARDLLQPISDTLFNHSNLERYTDGNLDPKRSPNIVQDNELERITQLIAESLQGAEWQKQLLAQLSDQHLAMEPPEPPYELSEVASLIDSGASVEPLLGCRPLYNHNFADILFINGEPFDVPSGILKYVTDLFSPESQFSLPENDHDKLALNQVITILVNSGVVFLER